MMIYRFVVKATRERFMEPPLREELAFNFLADSYDQAHSEVFAMLKRGGWKLEKFIEAKSEPLYDIRKEDAE